ncbi:MAG: hypothetical protein ACREGI_00630 [Candidatus Levyibacteriota bacterium]
MKLPKSLITVTPFSKALALFLFILFPFVGFYLGMMYQKSVTQISSDQNSTANTSEFYCQQDSDCTMYKKDTVGTALCCSNLNNCMNYYDDSVIAVSSSWVANKRTAACGEHIMCPMIAMMCTKDIYDSHMQVKAVCNHNVCKKQVMH